ncbi:MBL fold metallo-hydrolase [Sphingobacterium kitahiroshimense]|uniref:MBL fold metallo-hydrolase n=1 Tax=Sphingobacterium kitahiroshimense TaxID=470446 RepID=A0ABV0C1E5_9SPHI
MMKTGRLSLIILFLLSASLAVKAQDVSDSSRLKKEQAKAAETQFFGKEAFDKNNKTTLRWLGMAGFFINSRGTTFMIDPVLEGFDMPVLIDFPIKAKDVPSLDAVLITHADGDHFSLPTISKLKDVTQIFHSTIYVDSLMQNEGYPTKGHNIGDSFTVGPVKIRLTAADHAYQNETPGMSTRWFKNEDACGFWIETPDGTVWAPGDSRLLPEHLEYPAPDAILFDFSDSEWHFTMEGALKIAEAYPHTPLLLNHWGSVDAPDFTPFNGDPKELKKRVVNPDRVFVLAPGEPFSLSKLKSKDIK